MIYFCIVLYNVRAQECLTYITLEKQLKTDDKFEYRIAFFDNSENSKYLDSNRGFCFNEQYLYLTEGKNIGISKAYNKLIDNFISNNSFDGIFVPFDDDTNVTPNYLRSMYCSLDSINKVYVPEVHAGKMLISPSHLILGCRSVLIHDIDKVKKNKVTAINSGLWIRGEVFEKIRYDENIFLDGVDHKFFVELHKEKIPIKVVKEARLEQNLSQMEFPPLNSKLVRYRITLADNKKFAGRSIVKLMYFKISNLLKAKKLDAAYKTKKFTETFNDLW